MDSKLQIISGKYGGRRLAVPESARPTQNMARIALFNMLESGIINNMSELVVWDAFAGSGALGIECVSRYPHSRVLFSDVAYSSIRVIRENLSKLDVGGWAKTIRGDAIAMIPQYAHMMNLIFVDPPYAAANLGCAFVKRLAREVCKGTIVVWEQEAVNSTDADLKKWNVLRDKVYGRARFMILQKN